LIHPFSRKISTKIIFSQSIKDIAYQSQAPIASHILKKISRGNSGLFMEEYTIGKLYLGDIMGDIKFTREEISIIEKNLGFIVFDWAKHLINHILSQARNKGVKTVYMNTPESLDAGAITEGKTDYFYERLPQLMGFQKEAVNVRRSKEILWTYHFERKEALSNLLGLLKTAKQYTLQELPPNKQGAFIGILGRKPYYDENDIQKVLSILKKKQKKAKAMSKYYYDWDSKQWSGGQRFFDQVVENVVLQHMTEELKDFIVNEPALLKFWAYILSQHQHFGPDVVGFALVSKIHSDAWVINQIQTDAINAYIKIRRERNEEEMSKGLTEDTLRDMLEAQNRSKWIAKIEMYPEFKQQLLNNPGIIQQLPDDSQDIEKFISEQLTQMAEMGATQGLNLMQHFQSINFNARIFRIY